MQKFYRRCGTHRISESVINSNTSENLVQPLNVRALSNFSIAQNEVKPCPGCGVLDKQFNTVLMPDGCKHYAAKRCSHCDCFLGWIEKPANTQKREVRAKLIDDLLKLNVNQWEQGFLVSIRNIKKLSPRQQERLNQIAIDYGFGGEA